MPHGATQDRQVMVERSDRMWSTGEGNGKPLQYFCLEPHEQYEKSLTMMCFFGYFLIYFSCLDLTELLGSLNDTNNLEFFLFPFQTYFLVLTLTFSDDYFSPRSL